MAPSSIRCAYVQCTFTRKNKKDISFFRFPLEKRLMEKWLINCGNINLIDLTPVQLYEKRVCASHFSCKHFTNSLKNRLIQGAVPLHYNTKENADKQLNISTETLNLKREAVPKVYKQSRVAEDPIPSAASPLSEINDDSASELNKSPTLLQVINYIIQYVRMPIPFWLRMLAALNLIFIVEKRLMEKWLINCGNINLIDLTPVQLYEKRVCASHFSCKHFTNSLKNRLIQGAVPLHYNTKENADKQLNISTETLNLKREAVPKVYKQSRVAEDPIPSAASPLSEINDDSASELNKSPTLLQVVGVCDIFSFGLALYLTQTLYRVSRNEGAKRKSQLVDIILCRFNPNYLSPKMLLKRAGAPYR
ncbi:hypothetical protein FQA39_LY04722 [Lamprigera yunnana]|nr:hypothetical protein FQA39_LY04722 [Lamprigera yunnana]